MVTVHGLYAQFLANPSSQSLGDLDLINSVTEALGVVSDPNVPNSCLGRIHTGLSWYTEVAQIVRNAIEHAQSPESSQSQPLKRPQESVAVSPQVRARHRKSDSRAKRPRNSPPTNSGHMNNPPTANKARDKSITPTWLMPDVDKFVASENFASKSRPLQTPTHEFTVPLLPPLDTTMGPPPATNDDISQFLHETMPFASPVSSQGPLQPQPFFPPVPLVPPLATTGTPSMSSSSLAATGAGVHDLRDAGLFDSFLGRNDLPDAWDVEITDPPMSDDFFLQP